MMYKFMEMPDSTEITHSEMQENGSVKVCVERPVEGGFKTAYWTCHHTAVLTLRGSARRSLRNNAAIWRPRRILSYALRNIMDAIEAQHEYIAARWLKHFGEIGYYC